MSDTTGPEPTGPTGPTGATPPRAATPAGGRRSAPRPRRRLAPAAALAVVVPLACVGAAFGLSPHAPSTAPGVAPERVPLTTQTLVCPPPAGEPAPVVVGRTPGTGSGEVDVTGGGAGETVEETADPPPGGTDGPVVVAEQPAVVEGRGEAAPGLLAGRSTSGATAGAACLPPAADQWFTGLGAGPESSSVVELVNPESGPAVVDITLLGPDGALDVPDVAGVTVPARERLTLDLAEIAPTDDDLAARVQVVRGRLGVTVLDRLTPLGGADTSEWLSPQPEPGTTLLLPGLVGGEGARDLVVANPGTAATQVEVQVATPGGAVTPVGVRPLQVPAGGVAALDLADELATQVDEGAQGLVVTSAEPVTATLRSVVRDDLALSAAVPTAPATAGIVPDGDARVVLVAPPGQDGASVEVVARDDAGEEVASETVDLDPGAVGQVDLPDDAALVTTTAGDGGPVAASVAVRRGDGTLVLPLRAPVVDGLVPDVRPGLP